jgi:hypothetical protein
MNRLYMMLLQNICAEFFFCCYLLSHEIDSLMSEIIRAFCSVTLFILHADADEDISPGWQVRRGCGVPVCSRQELCGRSAPGSG